MVGVAGIGFTVTVVADEGFFFKDTATTEIYTLPLHDALPIFPVAPPIGEPFRYHWLPLALLEVRVTEPPALKGVHPPAAVARECRMGFSASVVAPEGALVQPPLVTVTV